MTLPRSTSTRIALAVVMLGGAAAVSAQSPDTPSAGNRASATAAQTGERSSWIDRIKDMANPGSTRVVRPLVGLIVPGSGLSGGVEIETPRLGGTPFGVGGDVMISIHNYQQVTLRAGLLAGRRDLPALRTFDASMASLMDPANTPASGTAVFVEHRYRRLPTLALFGETGDTLLESDFGRRSSSTDVVVQWAPVPSVGVGGRVGLLSTELFPGTDDKRLDTAVVFGDPVRYSQVGDATYVVSSLGAVWDRRDDVNRPAKGTLVQAATWIFRPTTDGLPAFTRTAVDARVFRRAGHPRHIVAARVLASMDHAGGEVPVPFHLQQTLGGSSTLRSFRSFRVRGERLAALLLESQWQAHEMVDVVFFMDSGVVGRTPLPHHTRGLLTSFGVGARGRMKDRILVRTELAFGRDGARFVFAMDAPF